MGLETGTFISDLNSANPLGSDGMAFGDNHLRLIKAVLQGTFPNATKSFRFPDSVATKTADYTVVDMTDFGKTIPFDATAVARTVTLPAVPTDGMTFTVSKVDATANTVTVSGGNINNGTSHVLSLQHQSKTFVYSSNLSRWYTAGTIPYTDVVGLGALAILSTVTTALISDASANGRSFISAANYAAMTALLSALVGDAGAGGTKGLVPAPSAGDAALFKALYADGLWKSNFPITQMTRVNTTSGTSIDFTGIPAGVKQIQFCLENVSTNGTSPLQLQLGDSGGIETAGYTGAAGRPTANLVATTGLPVMFDNAAANTNTGNITLTLMDSAVNLWSSSGNVFAAGPNVMNYCAGAKALSATLDRVRLTTVSGADTFDSGSANAIYS